VVVKIGREGDRPHAIKWHARLKTNVYRIAISRRKIVGNDGESVATIHRAWRWINFLDSAKFHGPHKNEELAGAFHDVLRRSVVRKYDAHADLIGSTHDLNPLRGGVGPAILATAAKADSHDTHLI
jgi:hypothetical protein